jgi:ligand-binding SRPBCC domain-containing protein
MTVVEHVSEFACPVEKLWAFHERPDAIQVLSPPGLPVRVVRIQGGLEVGAEKEFQIGFSFLGVTWLARHVACEPGRMFADVQVAGPFRSWRHEHWMEPREEGGCQLRDRVEFQAAGGWLGALVARMQLAFLFWWRHRVTRAAVEK